jgi:CRP/FNR family transcriptional regulator, cyclic AMP receptor protein
MQARPSSNLRVISLFEELSDAELARVAESCSTRTYEKNAHILGEQDPTTDVFFILAGTVRANSVSPKGREVIYSEFKAGAIFGEFSAIDGRPRSSAVSALTDCVVARMPAKAFFELLRSNGIVATKLVELLVVKIRNMSERVFEVSALSVSERLRRELVRLASTGERQGKAIVIKPAPTHYDIAAHIGSHREAVTREFNRMEAEKLLEVSRRQITILDLARLEQASEED